MFKDFSAHYPIRKKFDVIVTVVVALTAIPVALSAADLVGGEPGALSELLVELVVMLGAGAFLLFAKRRSAIPMSPPSCAWRPWPQVMSKAR